MSSIAVYRARNSVKPKGQQVGQVSTRCCKSYRLSAELEWQLCLAKLIIPQTSSYCITCIYTDTSNTYSKAYHAMDRLARTKKVVKCGRSVPH